MGACTHIIDLEDMPTAELARRVNAIREDHIRDHGVSYSGAWGSKQSGIELNQSTVFPSETAAHEYITEHNDKWGPVTAVRYRDVKTGSATDKKRAALLAKLREAESAALGWQVEKQIVTRVRAQKAKTKGCPHCGSAIAVQYIQTVACPVCRKDFLRNAQDLKAQAKAKEKQATIRAQIVALEAAAPARDVEVRWLVGGWCPS